jgi:hypothetical protein
MVSHVAQRLPACREAPLPSFMKFRSNTSRSSNRNSMVIGGHAIAAWRAPELLILLTVERCEHLLKRPLQFMRHYVFACAASPATSSTCFIKRDSGRKKNPITATSPATIVGYHSPK